MKFHVEEIDDGELILHRIPSPLSENTKPIEGGGSRPISQRMQLLKPEDSGLSCSRLKQTSPRQLLNQLYAMAKDPAGWGVCVLKVSSVRALGLDVVHKPEGADPGHCEIQGTFSRKTPRKLAKISRMLTEDEVETGIVADF